MADKSGVADQVLPLPKGGGAIRPIGETFEPDPHTGTGNYRIPLAVPPGRNRFQPELALAYSTGNGNGSFGLGWRLDVPNVSLKTPRGIPRYHDGAETYLLSGLEELVLVGEEQVGAERRRRYRPAPRASSLASSASLATAKTIGR